MNEITEDQVKKMTDDEIMNTPIPSLTPSPEEDPQGEDVNTDNPPAAPKKKEDKPVDNPADEPAGGSTDTPEEEPIGDPIRPDQLGEDGDNGADNVPNSPKNKSNDPFSGEEVEQGNEDEDEDEDEDTDTDGDNPELYKQTHDALFAPLKVNGRDITVESVEEMRKLASLGLNYTRKSQTLAEARKISETMKAHGISQDDLNLFIDIKKNKSETALAKLAQDTGIDLLTLENSGIDTYEAPDLSVDVQLTILKEAADELYNRPNGPTIIKDIKEVWDPASKELLQTNPELFLSLLEEDAKIPQGDSTRYDEIMKVVYKRSVNGQLGNTPFLTAYGELSDEYKKTDLSSGTRQATVPQGGTGKNPPAGSGTDTGTQDDTSTPTPKQDASNLKNRKKAKSAGSPKKSRPSLGKPTQNFFNNGQSDDDFMNDANRVLRQLGSSG